MARLPIPGSDNGTWGDILNGFLEVSHNADGTISGGSGAALTANNLSDLQSAGLSRTNLGLGSASTLSSTVGGDLSGTLPNPTVAKVNGITVSGTPSSGQLLTATSASAASWRTGTYAPLIGTVLYAPLPTGTASTDTAQWTTLINTANSSAPAQIIIPPSGTNYAINTALPTIIPQVAVLGPGKGMCGFSCSSAGAVTFLRQQNVNFPTTPSPAPVYASTNLAGPIKGFSIDLTSAGAGSVGLQVGDVYSADVDVLITNGTSAGTIGFLLQNTVGWSERGRYRITTDNCAIGVQRNGNNASSNNSFDYSDFWFSIRSTANQDGLQDVAEASFTAGSTVLYGNFNGAGSNSGTAWKLGADNTAVSYNGHSFEIHCEANVGSVGHIPTNVGTSTFVKGHGEIYFTAAPLAFQASVGSPLTDFVGFTGKNTSGALQFGSTIVPGMVGSVFVTNGWYPVVPTTGTALQITASTAYAVSLVVGRNHTFVAIGIMTTIAGTGGNLRMGIYADSGNGYPNTLVVDGGTVSAASTGPITITLSSNLVPGLYWLVVVGQGGSVQPTLTTYQNGGAVSPFALLGSTAAGAPNAQVGYSVAGVSSSLPSTFPGGASPMTSPPLVSVQA